MDKKLIAKELLTLAKSLLADNYNFQNYSISDEEKAKWKKEVEWFEHELVNSGFTDKPNMVPRFWKDFTKTVRGEEKTLTITVSPVKFPDSSMVAQNPWYSVDVSLLEGMRRWEKETFKTKKITELHRILTEALNHAKHYE